MRHKSAMLFCTAVITTTCFSLGPLARAQTRPSARPVGGAATSSGQRPLPLVAGAKSCADPVYVDAGPFAAAEEGSYWTRSGPQLVVVTNNFRKLADSLSPCTESRVRLMVSDGNVYPLKRPDPPGAGGRMPEEVLRSRWVFIVKPGEKPVALAVVRPRGYTEFDPLYHSHTPWPKPGMGVRVSLRGLPSLNDMGDFPQSSTPVRLGQLEIRVTAVGLAHGDWDGDRFLGPGHGHHAVQISFAIKNVSTYPNCTELHANSVRLFDNRRFEYRAWASSSFPGRIGQLLPGETAGASILVNVWDGTAPRLFTVSRDVSWEGGCAEEQHRPVDMHGGSEVRIPIAGVPAISPPAQ